jgi:D-alanine transaminase
MCNNSSRRKFHFLLQNRWNMCHLKTIALLPNILAKNEAHRQGCVEGFFYEPDGTVTEGTATNAWMVRGGELWTHPLGTKVLPGITRAQIVRIAAEIGVTVHEEKFTLDEAKGADEVFMSASNTELLPISRLGEATIGIGEPGPVYRKLHEAYRNHVAKSCGLAELESIS